MTDKEQQLQLMYTIHRFQRFDMSVIFAGTTRGEFFLMEILQRNRSKGGDGVCVSELAAALEVSPPAVSRMLRSMEQQGWLVRRIDPADRRNILVDIAPAGERMVETSQQALQRFGDGITQRMGQADMSRLNHLWNQLLDAMETELQNLTATKEKQENV